MKKHLLRINLNHKLMQVLLALVFTMGSAFSFATEYRYSDSWGTQGLSSKRQTTDGISLNFSMQHFAFEDREVNGNIMKAISFSESLLPNLEGNPDLPGFGRYIAIPQGATPVLEIVSMRTERFTNIEIAPAPRIPLDTETGPLEYSKNPQIYNKDAYFPAQPVTLDNFTQIRGIDVCMLNILPYQYNPVTKELIVYRDIEINITFEGGSRNFGDTKYRSAHWDQILEDIIFNYSSLPVVDYDAQAANRSRSTGYEYLIIVPNDPIFSQWADSIKTFRNEEGIYTGVVKLSDIGTNVSAATLETYINNAYNTWDIPPTAVLLLGDYGQASANANSITSPIYDNYCVSDNILADVNGDHMPDIVFARITANNAAQLESMVSRFINYERAPPTNPGFYANPITALGWQTVRWFQICSESVGGFWKNSLGKTPVRINKIYDGTPGSVWSTAQNTSTVVGVFGPSGLGYIPQSPATLGGWDGGNATMVNNALNAGAFMLMHRDHGNETGWGEPSYQNGNINGLQNIDLSWILSINCLTGKYNWSSESFTEKFHRHTYNSQPAGALGVTAASETSYSFVNDTYVWGLMDNMWPQFMPQYGSTPASRGVLPAFANNAGKYFLQQSSWPYNTNNKQVTYHLFHHHGDAFVRVCTEVPQTISATFSPTIYASQTEITVVTAANASLCISAYGSILATASTTMGTTVTLTIPPQFEGTVLKLTITKPNCNRYEGYITVVPDVTAANAGADATQCADQSVQLEGSATNYESLLWETSGDGSFMDATILNAIYTPGSADITNETVTLSLTASKTGISDSTDYVTITLVPVPVVFAGTDANICIGDNYSASEATAENYTELYWSTSGTGEFSDINSLNPRYTPSAEDILNGNVILTLNVSNGVCEVHTATVPVVINPNPETSIAGPAVACQNQTGVVYTASGENYEYQWSITGGSITSGAASNEVTVDLGIETTAYVSVIVTNEFGCEVDSSFEIALNEAPQSVITGSSAVCANSPGVVYSTPHNEGNTYTWNVTGGTIASGNDSNELTIDWEGNGTGTISLIETSTNQCSTTLEYSVNVSSPEINLVADTTICVNHSLNLNVEEGFASYLWSTGATSSSIVVSGAAIGVNNINTFEVTVTDAEGCSSTSSIDVTVETCAGIAENLMSSAFTLYPNPNTGEFSILFSETLKGEALVSILSTTGSILYSKVLTISQSQQTESFNVSELNRGLYFIRVETKQGSSVQKLVIK